MKQRKREYKLSHEAAEEVLTIFLDYYEIYEDDFSDPKEWENVSGAMDSVIKHIRMGYVEIIETEDGDVDVKQNPKNSKSGKSYIYESTRIAKSKAQMKTATNDDNYGKMYALMGALCGNGSTAVMNLKGVDYKVMESLSILFLQCTSG